MNVHLVLSVEGVKDPGDGTFMTITSPSARVLESNTLVTFNVEEVPMVVGDTSVEIDKAAPSVFDELIKDNLR